MVQNETETLSLQLVITLRVLKTRELSAQSNISVLDVITIAICAVICGADYWVAIETYGQAKQEWLKRFLELPNGIPSHDTFARIFALINPQKFQECFLSWIKSVALLTDGEVIAIDGKSLKHSYNKKAGLRAINMVSAWLQFP